jgi:transcriptional regulator with XRE-family HTH domain
MNPSVLKTAEPRILGERLKTARKARGLTQEFVAETLEFCEQLWSQSKKANGG